MDNATIEEIMLFIIRGKAMIGLLIKDLYTLKRQLRIVVLISVIYFAVAVLSKNLGMFTGIAMMCAIVLPITQWLTMNNANGIGMPWPRPLSRTTIVLSKYVLGVLLNIVECCWVCCTSDWRSIRTECRWRVAANSVWHEHRRIGGHVRDPAADVQVWCGKQG